MSYTPKNIVDGTLVPTSVTTLYTVPDKARCIIRKVAFSNTYTSAATVTLYLIPAGGSSGDAYVIGQKARTVSPGRDYVPSAAIGQILEAGAMIAAVASSAGRIAVRISGVEVL